MHQRPDFPWLAALVITSTLLLFNLTTKGIYSSHDGEIHIARIAQVGEALKHENPPIRWLSNFNFNFGYPTFVYAYSLPYYVSSLFVKVIGDVEITFKLLMLLSVVLSAVTFYYFAKLTLSRLAAFVGSIFYISAPYRFADIYERGALGEALSFILSPLMFMSPYIINRNRYFGFIATTLVVFTLIGIHAITFIIFLLATIAFCPLIFKKHLKLYFYFVLAVGLGFLLSSFQWVPMIFEQKHIELDKTYFNIFEGNFITIYQLLRIPSEGINTGTGIQLGSAQILVILSTTAYIFMIWLKRKRQNLHVIFFFTTIIVAAFLTTDISKPIWQETKPLQTLIFPWRFLAYTTFATAMLASFLIDKLQKSNLKVVFYIALIFIAVFPSRHYLKGHNWHTYTENFYTNYQDSLKLDNYYLPKGLMIDLAQIDLPQVSIIKGRGQVNILEKNSNLTTAQVILTENSTIQFHTIYFPGWILYLDGKPYKLENDFPKLEGIITSLIPKGEHKLVLKFKETKLRKIANFLSLGGFLILMSLVISRKRNAF